MEHRAGSRDTRQEPIGVAPLFVPADRPDRVRKARARGAQVLVIDLEDAVAPAHKDVARRLVAEVLAEPCPAVRHLVRVNAASTPLLLERDVAALRDVLHVVDGVVLPKVVSPDEVLHAEALLNEAITRPGPPVAVIPTVENAAGVRAAWAIAAASSSVRTLLFGSVDLSADLGIVSTAGGTELLMARSTVVLACAAAGLAKPIDGPYLHLRDTAGLEVSARHARALGFGGKAVIHPDQMAPVRSAFAPTEAEIDWALGVLAAFESSVNAGVGALRLEDGTFVDAPVAGQARAILRAAGRTQAHP